MIITTDKILRNNLLNTYEILTGYAYNKRMNTISGREPAYQSDKKKFKLLKVGTENRNDYSLQSATENTEK